MAVEFRLNSFGGGETIALPGSPTVADIKDNTDFGYQAGQVVRVNGVDASDNQVITDGAIVSFATPNTKHGA